MPLSDLVYRCPFCGRDPTLASGGGVVCPGCGRSFAQVGEGLRIRVRTGGGSAEEADFLAPELTRRLEALGGAVATATGPDGRFYAEADVRVERAHAEEEVRHRGRLLGFVERFGPPAEGRLVLTATDLRLRNTAAQGGADATWPLEGLRALQASSRSVQVSPPEGGVVLFRFPNDSSRRWEELLRHALAARFHALGLGEIVEYQPRIRTR